jgi:outer membrane receptor for ferrienterochelin and colicins
MKMKLRILALVFVLATLFSLSAQAGVLSGKVVDIATGTPISEVNVRIIELGKVVSTNKHGEFTVKSIPDGSYHLIATHVGYEISDTIVVSVPAETPAQLSLKSTPWVLNSVVVTGTRSPHLLKDVPVQTEVISRKDFVKTGATTVDEALNSSVGIQVDNDLSGRGATIRGIQGDRVLVLVDGERAVGRVRGTIDLEQFSLTNVEQIEVVKGTGSTLYGSDAMGGVINIITRRPPDDHRSATLFADYGTFGTANPTGEFRYGRNGIGVTLGAKAYFTRGFDLDKATPATNGQDEIKRINLDSRFTRKLNPKWSLGASARYMSEKRDWIESEYWPPLTFIYDDDETNRRYEGSADLSFLSGDKYNMKLKLSGTHYTHHWNKVDRESQSWVDTSVTTDDFIEASYASNYMIGQGHMATYGLNVSRTALSSKELSGTSHSDNAAAGYLSYEYAPIRSVASVLGVRYERHTSWGGRFNPSFNLMYSGSGSFKLRGMLAYGFRAPSIKEQYFTFDHTAAGYVVYGGEVALPSNIAIPPSVSFRPLVEENAINSSISAEFSYGSIGMHRITYFYNHIEDMIDFILLGFTPTYWRGVYIYQNIDRAITQGIEWESRVKLDDHFDLSLSYNYLYSRNLGTGEKLVNRPDHTGKVSATWHTLSNKFAVTVWGNYQSRKLWVARTNTGGNEGDASYAPHRAELNVDISQKIASDVALSLHIVNLFDYTNVTYGYWPGRQVVAGVRYDFGI